MRGAGFKRAAKEWTGAGVHRNRSNTEAPSDAGYLDAGVRRPPRTLPPPPPQPTPQRTPHGPAQPLPRPGHVQYLRKWAGLIDMEDSVGVKPQEVTRFLLDTVPAQRTRTCVHGLALAQCVRQGTEVCGAPETDAPSSLVCFSLPRVRLVAGLRAMGGGGHRNTARQATDSLRTEARGRQTQSNDPRNNQHNPQYANYWAPLTRKRHIPPHPAQPRHTNDWAPRTRKRHQREHRPQRPTERSAPTQHAKGRTGDCPGPRKETSTRRNVTHGGGGQSFAEQLMNSRGLGGLGGSHTLPPSPNSGPDFIAGKNEIS